MALPPRLCVLLFAMLKSVSAIPPPDHERVDTSYDWCDCKKGLSQITAWPAGNKSQAITVRANSTEWFKFTTPQRTINWVCDGMTNDQSTTLTSLSSWWSLRSTVEHKSVLLCSSSSGRLKWNQWAPTAERTAVPFSSFSDGYACLKIPALLRTSNGTLLAFAEARTPDCSDFSRTDLVVKRSTDDGMSWSGLQLVVNPINESGLCGNPIVIGNAAPVQLQLGSKYPNRIIVPHTHNNYEVWSTHSDDDGFSWSKAVHVQGVSNTSASGPDCTRNMSYFGIDSTKSMIEWIAALGWNTGVDPYQKFRAQLTGPWQFIGLGPPGSIQLRDSNRIVVPGYHSFIRGLTGGAGQGAGVALPVSQLYNNLALGHVLVSDDGGDSWELKSPFGFGLGLGANEAQLVQLTNGSVLVNSRSFSTGSSQFRVQAVSHDGCETFSSTEFSLDVPEPFNGCQGSVIALNSSVYLSHPNPQTNHGIAPSIIWMLGGDVNLTGRDHMTIWESGDMGRSYQPIKMVDSGAAGYSSLQGVGDESGLWVLYEQSDRVANTLSQLSAEALIGALSVLNPDRFVLRRVKLT